MSEEDKQEIRELSRSVNEMQLALARFQSHLESELGNNTRGLNSLKKEVDEIRGKFFGDNGVIIKLDRLDQTEKRRRIWDKAFIGAAAVLIIKIIYDIVTNMPKV